jgi:hypothetical protein
MLDVNAEGKMFCGVPNVRFRLRWEIWVDGKRACYQSWGPLAVLKFSQEKPKFEGKNASVIIRMLSLDGYIEQAMLRANLSDVEKIEYHHLIAAGHNVFAGLRIHTFTKGVWHCCTNGQVFKDQL